MHLELRERAEREAGTCTDPIRKDADACSASLACFVREAWDVLEPGTTYLHNWHIDLICEYLESITRGERTRLVVNIPPRYMKSLMCSVFWPVWEWARKPEGRWLFATYSQSLSNDHSVARRTLIQSEWFKDRWGEVFHLTGDQNQKQEFRNDRRGVMVATSVGGTATGKGGNRLIIDDPANPRQSYSDVQRETVNRWFNQTLSTRLNDKRLGAVVVVMQRLHQADLTNRCVELGYEVLSIPAMAEGPTTIVFPSGRVVERSDGDLLWPEREGPKEIERARETMFEFGFAGQYQQRPVPEGGGIFKPGMIQFTDAPRWVAPGSATRVRYWDKAGTEGGSGSRTAGVLMMRTEEGDYWILDVTMGRWGPEQREAIIRATAEADGPETIIYVEREPGSSGIDSVRATIRNLEGYDCREDRVTGPKETRWQPFAAQVNAGNIKALIAPWNGPFVNELSLLPHASLKDQADAASACFSKLADGAGRGGWGPNPTYRR